VQFIVCRQPGQYKPRQVQPKRNSTTPVVVLLFCNNILSNPKTKTDNNHSSKLKINILKSETENVSYCSVA